MFGFKKKMHRDLAAKRFLEHCRREGKTLSSRVIDALTPYCDGTEGKPTIAKIRDAVFIGYSDSKFKARENNLLDAHCYAIALASGLNSRHVIDPPDQGGVMLWEINKLIIEEDVGAENVGRAPNPFPRPGMHVSYAPGTFVHGTPSLQQRLTNRYSRLNTAAERLTMLLLSLRALRPEVGIHLAVYKNTDLGNGMLGRNKIGYSCPTPDQIDEWEDDLEITNAEAALAPLPTGFTTRLIAALEAVDPFWPMFSREHRLIW